MTPQEIQTVVREAAKKYEGCLSLAAKMWQELPDGPMAAVLACIGKATQHDDVTINTLGLYAFIGFITTAKLELGDDVLLKKAVDDLAKSRIKGA